MKLFALVNPGLEEISKQELKELVDSDAKINSQALEFEVKNKEEIFKLIYHTQSIRRIVLSLKKVKKLEELDFTKIDFNWKDFFSSELSFKVEVENIKGQDNRLEVAKQVAGKLFSQLEKENISAEINVKTPDFLVEVFHNGEDYFIGLDLCGEELNVRSYRLFPHSASFKGDLGYFFVRKSKFKPGNKLLVGFVKDGTIAIEAAIYASGLRVQNSKEKKFSFFKLPFFKGFDFPSFFEQDLKTVKKEAELEIKAEAKKEAKKETEQGTGTGTEIERRDLPEKNIFSFNEGTQNFTATRKNAQLAGVKNILGTCKLSLDELDVKFKENELDHLIFHVTTKDEGKINEIYYQAGYVLKKKGTLLLVGRTAWNLSISEKFKLISEEEIWRGESSYKLWLLEKK
ncbi:MAG: hypothetical protein KKA62_02040 [Nanoarchaeota archaeon]|nr:hypothetical protein [Nanoarchaeota archaeon]MBU1644089.1 hypothetical protein [Nanoarchaeota archaeon]MBU1976715.1 hypothetical protein [Nanoarchaeota archaeon]